MEAKTLNGAIRDNMMSWEEVEELNEQQDRQLWASLWTSSLTRISRTKLPTSETAKYSQRIYSGKIYWNGVNYKENDNIGHIFTLNENGQEEQVDQSEINIGSFSVHGKNLIWKNSSNQLIKFDLETKTETLIFDSGWSFGVPIATEQKVYVSDSSASPHPEYDCGFSINAYDLTTLEKETVKANEGLTDYFLDDIWEDWMVYVNCDEGGLEKATETAKCCMARAHGDVFLHQLSTGEEWSLTGTFGEQVAAKMWGPIVVWKDGRNRENGEGKALYGIDLCLHPELKDRFEECKSK